MNLRYPLATALIVIALTSVGVTGCGGSDVDAARTPSTATAATSSSASAAADATTSVEPITAASVVAAFDAAGLEADEPRAMTVKDYGLAPKVGEGVRFLIPSLGSDAGGRAFTGSAEDLAALRTYYDDLGKQSAALYSWTYANTTAGVLVQLNGDLPKATAEKYGQVVASLGK